MTYVSLLDCYRMDVENGGGIWVGIQECEGHDYDLVLFNSRKTGSTLALKTTEITMLRVIQRIAQSDAQFSTQEKK